MENMNDNYYEFIGLKRDATVKDIKRACNELLKKYHPDKCKEDFADGITKHINKIKEILCDPEKRIAYNKTLSKEKSKAQEEQKKGEGDEAKQRAKEEAERKANEIKKEAERKAKETAGRNRKEEAGKRAREEAERRAREEVERRVREEVERRAREEVERKRKEEAERKRKEEAERNRKEEAERNRKEEAERNRKEEAERKERDKLKNKRHAQKLVIGMILFFVVFGVFTLMHWNNNDSQGTVASAKSAPEIEWQKSLGGSGDDTVSSVQLTSDSGYIIAGSTYSTDGDVTGNQGDRDYWVVKMDTNGDIIWQKSLGGSGKDEAFSIQQTSDSGYIVAGRTTSKDGDVTGNHGLNDAWIVKLDTNGNIQWQKCIGGSNNDNVYNIQQTSDGSYIFAGSSFSNDGDVTGYPQDGYWIVKLDTNGNILWQKFGEDIISGTLMSIQQTSDSGYIVAGETSSTYGDVTGKHGNSDYLIVKLDTNGDIKWQKSLGGSELDAASSIQQTSDGGYIVSGGVNSNDDDVTGNHGEMDYWIVKLDTNGDIKWQKSLGGSEYDSANSIQQTSDGGYIVVGDSPSNDGDVTGNHGNIDSWIVKLDTSGNIEWQKCIGGSNNDLGARIQQTSDGGYIIIDSVHSTDGDVTGNHGDKDYWIVKLRKEGISPEAESLIASNGNDTNSKSDTITVLEEPILPVADFSATPTSGKAPLKVQFIDMSTGSPTSWSWNFGDGNISTEYKPTHTYSTAGIYAVEETVINEAGKDTEIKTDYITVTTPLQTPAADFSASQISGEAPLEVSFTDESTGSPNALKWNFGDSSDVVEVYNPTHTYTTAGTYTVKETVTNEAGEDTEIKESYITVTAPLQLPDADFSASQTTGEAPMEIEFIDKSTGSPASWKWDFGDGSDIIEAYNPTHTYTKADVYTVKETVTNEAGEDTEIKTDYITVTIPEKTGSDSGTASDYTSLPAKSDVLTFVNDYQGVSDFIETVSGDSKSYHPEWKWDTWQDQNGNKVISFYYYQNNPKGYESTYFDSEGNIISTTNLKLKLIYKYPPGT